MADVKGWRSPVLLIHGDDDRNVNFRQTVELVEALRGRVHLEQLIFPDEIHDSPTHAHWLQAYHATWRTHSCVPCPHSWGHRLAWPKLRAYQH